MTPPKDINIAIHCESEALFLWLKYTLVLPHLEKANVTHIETI